MRSWMLLAALVALPAAAAQSTGILNPPDGAVTLHLHLVDVGQDFPINTQPAQELGFDPLSSLAAHTFTCLPNPPAGGQPFMAFHTFYGYSSPGYVEYGFQENGRPRVASERQLGYDLVLDEEETPELVWFLTTEAGEASALPLPLANVVVEATLRVGDPMSVDDKSYDAGPVIATGRSEPALLFADQTDGAEHSMAGDRHVYGFRVPLEVGQAAVGRFGYTLRIDVFVENPACADPGAGETVMPNLVAPYFDADHRPRIEARVREPLRITSMRPQFVGDGVVIQALVSSVWGNYDVDEGNLTLEVDGPGSRMELEPATVVQRWREHYHHADPVEVTWAWNATGQPDGLYHFRLRAGNDQSTAVATATAAVELRPGDDVAYSAGEPELAPQRDAPAVAPGLALLMVALAAVLRRVPGGNG
jgi:hypothetical protein